MGLEGTWKAVSLEVEGKRQDSDALLTKQPVTAIRWTFAGNKIKIRGGDKAIEATFTQDSSTTPKKIDLTFHIRDEDVEEQVTALGIYSLEGDTLKVCFILDPQVAVRPLKFDVKDFQGTNSYTFRRERSLEQKRRVEKDEKPVTNQDEKQKIENALSRPVNLDFKDHPLHQAVSDLRDVSGLNIVFDRPALERAYISLNTPVSLSLKNVSLKSALTLLLGSVHLTYVMRDKTILITTPEAAAANSTTQQGGTQEKSQPRVHTQVASKKDEIPVSDKERLQGKWKMICKDKGFIDGEWTIKGTTIRVKARTKEEDEPEERMWTWYHHFHLDETANPKRIILIDGEADDLFDIAEWEKRFDDADEQTEGMYSLTGDTLKVCLRASKWNKRPTSFRSEDGIMIVLKRETPRSGTRKNEQKDKNAHPPAHRSPISRDKP